MEWKTILRNPIRKNFPEFWPNSWLLDYDNAPVHYELTILAKEQIVNLFVRFGIL